MVSNIVPSDRLRNLLRSLLLCALLVPGIAPAKDKVDPDVARETLSAPPASDLRMEVAPDRPDALYQVGDSVTFRIRLLKKDGTVERRPVTYHLRGEKFFSQNGEFVTGQGEVTVPLTEPGFLLCEASCALGPDPKETVKGSAGAGAAPLQIRAETPEPPDFDEFWKEQLEDLAATPLEVLEKIPVEVTDPKFSGKVRLYDVKVSCAGGKPVSGYLAMPVGSSPGGYPVVVSFHGAGVNSARPNLAHAAAGAISFDINAHGLPNGQPAGFYQGIEKGELARYYLQGLGAREAAYFRGMYLRVVRALQFVQTLAEWDRKTLIVTGGSQGGAQALVGAALVPEVTHCFAAAPWLCNFTGVVEGSVAAPWPGFLRMNGRQLISKTEAKALPYFDVAIFAKRIRAKSVVSVAFADQACPPTSVYVAYNNLRGEKEIINCPGESHSGPAIYTKCADALSELLGNLKDGESKRK